MGRPVVYSDGRKEEKIGPHMAERLTRRRMAPSDLEKLLHAALSSISIEVGRVARDGQLNDRLWWPRRAISHEWGFFVPRPV